MLQRMRRLRWTELQLLVAPALLSIVGLILVLVAGQNSEQTTIQQFRVQAGDVWVSLAFIGLILAIHVWLTARRPQADQVLLPVVAMLTAIGLVMTQRLQPAAASARAGAISLLANKQAIWIGISFVALFLVLSLFKNLSFLRRYKYTWLVLGIGLLVAALAFGGTSGQETSGGPGSRLWFNFGFFQFQPSELLKVILVVFLAAYLVDKRYLLGGSYKIGRLKLPPLPYLAPLGVMVGLALVTVVVQRDLGSALLFFGIFLTMLYVASGQGGYVVAGLSLFALGAYVLYNISGFDYVRDRVGIWLDPWARANDKGYQVVQSLYALANGGIAGQGVGLGRPDFIPVVQSDFIFAAIGEEVGLAGTLAVVALYLILVFRGYHIALRSPNRFAQLLAIGLTTIFGLQAIIIIAGTTRLIPLTGITLPFISYGGSSLITNYLAIGLLLRISAARADEF